MEGGASYTTHNNNLITSVRTGNETIGLNHTWAHNLFIRWALGFPTLGRSRHRDSK